MVRSWSFLRPARDAPTNTVEIGTRRDSLDFPSASSDAVRVTVRPGPVV